MTKFQKTIVGQYFGHQNTDTFRIFYDPKTRKLASMNLSYDKNSYLLMMSFSQDLPSNWALIAPGLSPRALLEVHQQFWHHNSHHPNHLNKTPSSSSSPGCAAASHLKPSAPPLQVQRLRWQGMLFCTASALVVWSHPSHLFALFSKCLKVNFEAVFNPSLRAFLSDPGPIIVYPCQSLTNWQPCWRLNELTLKRCWHWNEIEV